MTGYAPLISRTFVKMISHGRQRLKDKKNVCIRIPRKNAPFSLSRPQPNARFDPCGYFGDKQNRPSWGGFAVRSVPTNRNPES